MTIRVDSASLIPGYLVVGNNGLGIKGSGLPTSGEHGDSILYQLANLPAENDVEFRMLVTSQPIGELITYEDGSFFYDGPSSSFGVEWFKDGVSQGAELINMTIGALAEIDATITESFNGFSETITASIVLPGEVSATIMESFGGFKESISASVLGDISIGVTESFGGFGESITVEIPSNVVFNPKNVIRVSRRNNIVRVR